MSRTRRNPRSRRGLDLPRAYIPCRRARPESRRRAGVRSMTARSIIRDPVRSENRANGEYFSKGARNLCFANWSPNEQRSGVKFVGYLTQSVREEYDMRSWKIIFSNYISITDLYIVFAIRAQSLLSIILYLTWTTKAIKLIDKYNDCIYIVGVLQCVALSSTNKREKEAGQVILYRYFRRYTHTPRGVYIHAIKKSLSL